MILRGKETRRVYEIKRQPLIKRPNLFFNYGRPTLVGKFFGERRKTKKPVYIFKILSRLNYKYFLNKRLKIFLSRRWQSKSLIYRQKRYFCFNLKRNS